MKFAWMAALSPVLMLKLSALRYRERRAVHSSAAVV